MKTSFPFRGLRRFLILWSSQSLSALGSAMTSFALIIWVYQQKGTATSVALLSACTYLPSVLLCFAAGALADRWDKKRMMLVCDLLAALGTVSVALLYCTNSLQIWHLFGINFLISLMNAFQKPASYVATSLLAPKAQYARASGLQSLSGSLISILTPALAAAVLAFGGLEAVLLFDLASFAAAFLTLLFAIELPGIPAADATPSLPFAQSCMEGFQFLREHAALLRLILFFSLINLLAFMGGGGSLLSALILARTGGDQNALGFVMSAVGLGTLVGSILVTLRPVAKSRTRAVFLSCALAFALCDPLLAVGRSASVWVVAAFAGNLPLPSLNANLNTIMRTHVPLSMQGRVFSARDTLQYATVPLGLLIGGIMADRVLEPLLAASLPLQRLLSPLVGNGRGAGLAFMFLVTGLLGCILSLLSLRDPVYDELQ